MVQHVAGLNSRQDRGNALNGRDPAFPKAMCALSVAGGALLAAVAFAYADLPIARHVFGTFPAARSLGNGLSSAVLLTIEASIVLALVILRLTRGRLSPFRETVVLACLTSICTYAINDSGLKVLFGVPNPVAVLGGARHAFHLFAGSSKSSFPSGHMALASAFAGVFMRLYGKTVLLFSVLLLIAAILLILGDWHFVSDVIAGTVLGVWAGILAGELWLAHAR